MRGDILGLERRRRWGDEKKLEIVLSVGLGGATVTQVAQRNDVTRQQIYAWRHELKKKGLLSAFPEALFLPVELDRRMEFPVPTAANGTEARRPAQIELQLANGLDPQAYLADILARIHDHKINRLDDLLPWNWAPMPTTLPEAA